MSKYKKIKKEDTARTESIKKNLKTALRVAVAVVILAAAVTAVIYFVPKKNGSFGVRQTKTYFEVRSFLDDVIEVDFDSAVDDIWFYDSEDDVSAGTEIETETAESTWKKRVDEQKNGNYANYITDYSNLKVYLKDGELYADVRLHIYLRGVKTYTSETFRFCDGKIYSITDYKTTEMNTLEKALSGYLGE